MEKGRLRVALQLRQNPSYADLPVPGTLKQPHHGLAHAILVHFAIRVGEFRPDYSAARGAHWLTARVSRPLLVHSAFWKR